MPKPQSPKRNSPKRNSPKRNSPKRNSPRGSGSTTWQLPPLTEAERERYNRQVNYGQLNRGKSYKNFPPKKKKSPNKGGSIKRSRKRRS